MFGDWASFSSSDLASLQTFRGKTETSVSFSLLPAKRQCDALALKEESREESGKNTLTILFQYSIVSFIRTH